MTGITPTGTVQVYWNPDDWSVCSQTCAGGMSFYSLYSLFHLCLLIDLIS